MRLNGFKYIKKIVNTEDQIDKEGRNGYFPGIGITTSYPYPATGRKKPMIQVNAALSTKEVPPHLMRF